ncbi:MAG: hypothetical protein RLZZ196_66 [Bacteroidota bacterium]|jgi:hypothetical protein
MTDYTKTAASDIRTYVWDAITDSGILDENDYYADGFSENLIPIIPAQQIPEFNNLLPGKTYLIYDYEVQPVPVQWWMTEESMTITAISQNYETLIEINNLMQDLFRRYDESASDVNSYFSADSDFVFHNFSIDSVMSPEPFKTEGDYQISSSTFRYNYSRKTGANGRF